MAVGQTSRVSSPEVIPSLQRTVYGASPPRICGVSWTHCPLHAAVADAESDNGEGPRVVGVSPLLEPGRARAVGTARRPSGGLARARRCHDPGEERGAGRVESRRRHGPERCGRPARAHAESTAEITTPRRRRVVGVEPNRLPVRPSTGTAVRHSVGQLPNKDAGPPPTQTASAGRGARKRVLRAAAVEDHSVSRVRPSTGAARDQTLLLGERIGGRAAAPALPPG